MILRVWRYGIFWVWPPPSNSDHHYMFRLGDPELNLHFLQLPGLGHTQGIFTYMYPLKYPNVGKYSIHWVFGNMLYFHQRHVVYCQVFCCCVFLLQCWTVHLIAVKIQQDRSLQKSQKKKTKKIRNKNTIWWWFPSSQLPLFFSCLVLDPEHACLQCMSQSQSPLYA